MAIQHRRGQFVNFDPSRLVPGEWAVVLEGDNNAGDGQTVYICFSPGRVKRVAFIEDVAQIVANLTEQIYSEFKDRIDKALGELSQATADANQKVEELASIIEAANTSKETLDAAAEQAKSVTDTATKAAEAANSAAQKADSATQAATEAKDNANAAADRVDDSISKSETATQNANDATQKANEAAQNANDAVEEAKTNVQNTIDDLNDRANEGEFNGATFTPSWLNDTTVLHWENDHELPNPVDKDLMGSRITSGIEITGPESLIDGYRESDIYFNTSNFNMYQVQDGTWSQIATITGPLGIGEITSEMISDEGDYRVEVEYDGPNAAKNIHFKFYNSVVVESIPTETVEGLFGGQS